MSPRGKRAFSALQFTDMLHVRSTYSDFAIAVQVDGGERSEALVQGPSNRSSANGDNQRQRRRYSNT